MVNRLPPEAPQPRLCLVRKTYPEQEYGYNLHAERGKGQFVGNVDNGSPADLAGLLAGDRIFAVNGALIADETHKQVVGRIKEHAMQCELLVIEEAGEQWYKENGIPITLDLPNIKRVVDRLNAAPESTSPPPPSWYQPPAGVVIQSDERTNGENKPPNSPHSNAAVSTPAKAVTKIVEPPTVPVARSSDGRPLPRLCKLVKHNDDDEYGFNLHAERGKGHFIGSVDSGGMADKAGLVMGQRIVGVNDELIFPNTPHKDVVYLIRQNPKQCFLLVAAEHIDQWYKERGAQYSFEHAEIFGNKGDAPIMQRQTNSSGPPVYVPEPPKIAVMNENGSSVSSGSTRSSRSSSMADSGHKVAAAAVQSNQQQQQQQHTSQQTTTTHKQQPHVDKRRQEDSASGVRHVPTPPPDYPTHQEPINNGDYVSTTTTTTSGSQRSYHPDHPVVIQDLSPQPSSSTYDGHNGDHSNVGNSTAAPTKRHSPPHQSQVPSAAHYHPSTHSPRSTGSSQLDNVLTMSAAEYRASLSQRKKADPRFDSGVSLQEKHRVVSNM